MLTNGNLDSLETGRTYWIAWQLQVPGHEIGCGLYQYTGRRVNTRGRHQFNAVNGDGPIFLLPAEVTSAADVDHPEQLVTAADIAQLLDSGGLDCAPLASDSLRGDGFYTADLTLSGVQAVGVYFRPAADKAQTRRAELILNGHLNTPGLIVSWVTDRVPQLAVWR